MADYQLYSDNTQIIRTRDKATIPNNAANADWVDYQAWLAAGNTPDTMPQQVSPALDSIGTGKTTLELLGVADNGRD